MKAIVTIVQCKRVFLPYIFSEYVFPKMKEIFPGEMELFIIQHTSNLPGSCKLKSSHLPDEKLDLVKKWTMDGRYRNATIVKHSECCFNYPHLPSMRIGVELAVQEKADFHLWLEDDSIILDYKCNEWSNLLRGKLIGEYIKSNIVYVAHFLSTLEFDKLFLQELKHKKSWNIRSKLTLSNNKLNPQRVEPRLTLASRGKRVILPRGGRRVIKVNKKTDIKRLKNLINKIAPHEIDFLGLDF